MIQNNVSLKEYNSFKCDYLAKYLSIINDAQQLKVLLGNELVKTLPKLILGNGMHRNYILSDIVSLKQIL
jgi:UDP-N-acetylenolpyruvoylglucosamine reductase